MQNHFSYVAIADDNPMFRYLLQKRIAEMEFYTIVIEAINGKDLIEKLKKTARLPHICILDIGMPEMNGYEAIKIIMKRWPAISVLVFSQYYHTYVVGTMIKLGAKGFISKQDDTDCLYDAIASIKAQGYYYSKYATKEIFEQVHKGKLEQPIFTPIEIKLLNMFCQDMQYSEIAKRLGVSTHTIEKHKQNISFKTRIKSREGLILFAIQNDLFDHTPEMTFVPSPLNYHVKTTQKSSI